MQPDNLIAIHLSILKERNINTMNSSNKKPILVTGSHRSGSTWVGRMLALSPSVGYIHEPFNIRHRHGICKAHFEYWFQYICDEN